MTSEATPIWTYSIGSKDPAAPAAGLTADGQVLAGGVAGLYLLDPVSGEATQLHEPPGRTKWKIAVSPTGDEALVSMGGHVVTLWDLDSGAMVGDRDLAWYVSDVDWPDDYDQGLATTGEGLFQIDLTDGGFWDRLEKGPEYRALASGGKRAAASRVKGVELWRLGQRKTVYLLEGHDGFVEALAVAPSGELLVSGDQAGMVRTWACQRRRVTERNQVHEGPVTALSLSPRARRLLTGGADGVMTLWDLPTNTEMLRLEAHRGGVTSLAWNLDGTQAVSAGLDGNVKLWELPGQAQAPTYSPQRTYRKGDLIGHKHFGEGEVTGVQSDRIQVRFSDETKTLVHALGQN